MVAAARFEVVAFIVVDVALEAVDNGAKEEGDPDFLLSLPAGRHWK